MKKQNLVLLLFCLLINFSGFSQKAYSVKSKKAIKQYELAVTAYKQLQFDNVFKYTQNALKYDPNFIEIYLLLADVYKTTGNITAELSSLKKVIELDPEFFPYTLFNYGSVLYSNGMYVEALNNLQIFVEKGIGHKNVINKAKNLIYRCNQAIDIMATPVEFTPVNLGSNINNRFEQYWPSLSLDGNTIIYTVLKPDSTKTDMYGNIKRQEDFYISLKDDNGWQLGEPLGPPLNTNGNEGAHKLSADGSTIVFTGCNRSDGFGNCDIYFSFNQNGKWTDPINAGKEINTPYSEKQPAISPDGRFLYFSSNRPGGKGGMDLYVSQNIGGNWTTPENMDSLLNTKGNEVSPFIHPDNSTLYFSSDSLPGLGMKDIFFTRKDSNNNWTKPHNLGYPINSHRDEIGLVVDAKGEKAYYATNLNSKSTNIFAFDMPTKAKPNPVSYVSGKIFDSETNERISATFQLINLHSGDTVMQSVAEKRTGKYLACLPSGFNYGFNVHYPGYLFYSENFDLEKVHSSVTPLELDIPLVKIKKGSKVVLDNVFFETDSYSLTPYSKPELQKLFLFVKNNPNLHIEIGGHTDNTGNVDYNLKLSENRAKSVFSYLISKGISDEQISYKGYGQSEPIASNKTNEGRAKNRRTELKILE